MVELPRFHASQLEDALRLWCDRTEERKLWPFASLLAIGIAKCPTLDRSAIPHPVSVRVNIRQTKTRFRRQLSDPRAADPENAANFDSVHKMVQHLHLRSRLRLACKRGGIIARRWTFTLNLAAP
jgi:hypothetical protein